MKVKYAVTLYGKIMVEYNTYAEALMSAKLAQKETGVYHAVIEIEETE